MAEEFVRFYALFYVSYRAFQQAINVYLMTVVDIWIIPQMAMKEHAEEGSGEQLFTGLLVFVFITASLLCVTGEPHKSY